MFGLNEVLSIIILFISIGLLVAEIKTKKATDLITNIVISCLLLGVSLYNLISIGFSKDSIILSVCYSIVVAISVAYTVLYVLHYKKYKNSVVEPEENTETTVETENIEEK